MMDMKKQTYSIPSMVIVELGTSALLSTSSIRSGGKGPSGYGGVDSDGSMDPSARRYRGFEEEDDEDEDF